MGDLDGPTAAPAHHRVIFENDYVRVPETAIRAGDAAPLHTHLAPHVMIWDTGSHFVGRDENGEVLLDTRVVQPPFALPEAMWSDGLPAHTLENTGADDIRVHAVELKQPLR